MGKVALAAKITHVPSMYLSELDGPRKGTRQDAIDGHVEIGRRCREAGVDTIVVFDTHWLVNANYHVNCAPGFEGVYTSNELPHFISNMRFGFPGNPALGRLLARACTEAGVETLADAGHRSGGLKRVDGDPHHLRARLRELLDLARRRADVGGVGVGHRLHHDGRVAPDQDVADPDLAGPAADDG
jgi:hypothetical protein